MRGVVVLVCFFKYFCHKNQLRFFFKWPELHYNLSTYIQATAEGPPSGTTSPVSDRLLCLFTRVPLFPQPVDLWFPRDALKQSVNRVYTHKHTQVMWGTTCDLPLGWIMWVGAQYWLGPSAQSLHSCPRPSPTHTHAQFCSCWPISTVYLILWKIHGYNKLCHMCDSEGAIEHCREAESVLKYTVPYH